MSNKEHMATARGFNLAVSTKFSIEVAKFVRGRRLQRAKDLLQGVIDLKTPVPMTRFNRDQGHKSGPMAAGRFPINVAKQILTLVESAEMNAMNKGLDVNALVVKNIIANKGTGVMRYGRHRGRSAKRTHVEVILEEKEKKKAKKAPAKKAEASKPKGEKQ